MEKPMRRSSPHLKALTYREKRPLWQQVAEDFILKSKRTALGFQTHYFQKIPEIHSFTRSNTAYATRQQHSDPNLGIRLPGVRKSLTLSPEIKVFRALPSARATTRAISTTDRFEAIAQTYLWGFLVLHSRCCSQSVPIARPTNCEFVGGWLRFAPASRKRPSAAASIAPKPGKKARPFRIKPSCVTVGISWSPISPRKSKASPNSRQSTASAGRSKSSSEHGNRGAIYQTHWTGQAARSTSRHWFWQE